MPSPATMDLADPNLLCPTNTIKTVVPLTARAQPSEKISATVCSEFREIARQVSPFSATQCTRLVLDFQDGPMVFTVGKDLRFYCIRHITGPGWTSYDITPGVQGATVTAFDVIQHINNKIAIVVAVSSSVPNATDLYYVSPFTPTKDLDISRIAFEKLQPHFGSVNIGFVSLSAEDNSMSSCFILAATPTRSTTYFVIPDDDEWKYLSIPTTSVQVVQSLALTTGQQQQMHAATLYRQQAGSSDVGTDLVCTDIIDGSNTTLDLSPIGGDARYIAMAFTSSAVSDLYVAGSKGIGYYAGQPLQGTPSAIILPELAFKQVTAVEKAIDGQKSQITVLAISTSGDMYFIEGTRKYKGSLPTFAATGLPIRTGVGFLSPQYISSLGAPEVIYVETSNGQLRHLIRDPKSTLWAEQGVYIAGKEGNVTSLNVFECLVSLKGSLGSSVGTNFVVGIVTTELTYALINDRSYRLGPNSVDVTADATGRLHIIIQADISISCPVIGVFVQSGNIGQFVPVEPRQRLVMGFELYKSGSDLKNAKSSTGKSIFPNTTIPDSTFDEVAKMLQTAVGFLKNTNPLGTGMAPSVPNPGFLTAESDVLSFGYRADLGSEFVSSDEEKSILGAVGDVVETVVERIGTVVKAVVKVGIQVVSGALNFIAKIAGKLYRWALNVEGMIIRSVTACLKEELNVDATRLFSLFGFGWDHENIVKTQKNVADAATKGTPVLKKIVTNNVAALKTCIENCKTGLKQYIQDQRIPQQDDVINFSSLSTTLENSGPGKLLKPFLDNPIVHEILHFASKWILNASCLVDDVLSLPGADSITKLTADLAQKIDQLILDEGNTFVRFFNDLIAKFKDVLAGRRNLGEFFTVLLSDAFWTVFDAIDAVAEAFLDIFAELISTILDVFSGVIKIPGVSAFWEALNGTKFSILNVLSMQLAHIMYLITMLWKEKLPFDLMSPWADLLPDPDKIILTNSKPPSGAAISEDKKHSHLGGIAADPSTSQLTPSKVLEVAATVLCSASTVLATLVSYPRSPPSIPGEGGEPPYGSGNYVEMSALEDTEIPFIDDAPPIPRRDPNLPITRAVEWIRLVWNGISITSEFVLLLVGWSSSDYGKYLKGAAVVLKGIEMVHSCAPIKLAPLKIVQVQAAFSLLPPIANGLNALSGFLDFYNSGKIASDDWGLIVSIGVLASAVLDGVTVVACALDEVQVAAATITGSGLINAIAGLGGGVYILYLKDQGK